MIVPVDSNPFPKIERRTDPLCRLAAAVISLAVQDATNGLGSKQKSAITWLLQDDDGFPFWCNILGKDPDQTRQVLSNLLDSRTEPGSGDFQSLLEPATQDYGTLWSAGVLGNKSGEADS